MTTMAPISSPSLSPSPPPSSKVRSNSDGPGGFNEYHAFKLKRAKSSEAQLPSPTEDYHHRRHEQEKEDDLVMIISNSKNRSVCYSGSSITSNEDSKSGFLIDGNSSGEDRDETNHNTTTTNTPSPTRSRNATTPPRPQSVGRNTSYTSDGSKSPTKRQLQTIESGISLSATDPQQQQQQSSPRPPHRPSSSPTSSSQIGIMAALPPIIPYMDTIDKSDSTRSNTGSVRPDIQRSRMPSDYSYYSVDAGKHGFLTHGHLPQYGYNNNYHNHHSNSSNSYSNNNDNDSVNDSSVGEGSLVFKYLPGQETPPAEYALPASILRVYGDEVITPNDDHGTATTGTNGHGVQWHHNGSQHHVDGSKSSIVYSPSLSEDEDEEGSVGEHKAMSSSGHNMSLKSGSKRTAPPTAARAAPSSSLTVPHLMAMRGGDASTDSSTNNNAPTRVLPYHERKRLMELEEEEQRRQDHITKMMELHKIGKTNGNKFKGGKGSKRGGLRVDSDNGGGERTPLTGGGGGRGGKMSKYGTSTFKNENQESDENANNSGRGWFGQLVAIVTGSSSNNNSSSTIDDENHPHSPEEEEEEENDDDQEMQRNAIMEEYHDRSQAFLKKTEKERLKMKEQSRMDELNHVMIPVTKQSFSHPRARMSSLTNVLDSIADCSSESIDEEEGTCSSSNDDEESGSSYYFGEKTVSEQPPTPAAPAARVWKYGEPPTTTTTTNPLSKANHSNSSSGKKKKKKRSSNNNNNTPNSSIIHDHVMRRERLMQEEYEYRLHLLKRENEKLSRRFRVFVLVAVALIFVGALGFAFVVCVRMLMSI